MKKSILSLLLITTFSFNVHAQYCIFFDLKAEEPEMVVSAMQNLMSTEWGKSIQATKSLFAYGPNGNIEATHSIQFCFPDEAAFESAFMSYGQSMEAQMVWERKLRAHAIEISQTLNTPVWYNGEDWAEDNVFMIYQMDITNPALYLKEFTSMSPKLAKKMGYTENSYGLAFPIVGKNKDFTHFVWMGHNDIKSALSNTKAMFADPMFVEFSKKVSGVRTLVNSLMLIRIADF